MKQIEIEKIYRKMPLELIPWNIETPPAALVALVDSRIVTRAERLISAAGPATTQCGLRAGGLMSREWIVLRRRLNMLRSMRRKKRSSARLSLPMCLANRKTSRERLILPLIGSCCITFPEQRQKNVANVHRLLNPKGKYLSLCFNEGDLAFGGAGKYRRTR
jgi:hypothetical protein